MGHGAFHRCSPLLPCRHASSVHLKAVVKALLADAALQPDMEHVDGAGRLLAAAVAGASGGLHSRAPEVLALVLQEALVTPADFRSSKVGGPMHVGIFIPLCIFQLGTVSFCPGTLAGERLMGASCPDIAAGVRLLGAAGGFGSPADIHFVQGEHSCPVHGLHILT